MKVFVPIEPQFYNEKESKSSHNHLEKCLMTQRFETTSFIIRITKIYKVQN